MKKLIALGLAGVMMLSSAGFAGSLTDPPPSRPHHIQPPPPPPPPQS